MKEHTGVITFQGNPLTLVGNEVKVGGKAPDFMLLDSDLTPVSLADFEGKTLIIAVIPSLDTPVCDMETVRFNKEAAAFGDNVRLLTVSMDLPFAQARWRAAKSADNVTILSDHKDASFGEAYGVLIKELRLLARVVFIVDGAGIIRYIQMVKDVASEPDYADVLAALRALA